eukprot:1160748-Pelagomonas_calceolata.AAC.4
MSRTQSVRGKQSSARGPCQFPARHISANNPHHCNQQQPSHKTEAKCPVPHSSLLCCNSLYARTTCACLGPKQA